MDGLKDVVDHPYVLVAALIIGFPVYVLVASTIFPSPEDDAASDSWLIPAILLDQTPPTVLGIKISVFLIACGAFTTLFYKLGVWLIF